MSWGNRVVVTAVCNVCGAREDAPDYGIPDGWEHDYDVVPGYMGGGRHEIHRCAKCRKPRSTPAGYDSKGGETNG